MPLITKNLVVKEKPANKKKDLPVKKPKLIKFVEKNEPLPSNQEMKLKKKSQYLQDMLTLDEK